MAHVVQIDSIQRLPGGQIEVTWAIDGETRGHYFGGRERLVAQAQDFDLDDILFFFLVACWRARNNFNPAGDATVMTLKMTVDLTLNTPIVIGLKV